LRGVFVMRTRKRTWRPRLEVLEDRTVPSTFVVNTTADTMDANPGDGLAQDSSGNTSLRAAIMEANALPGADTIQLPVGTYVMTIPGANEDAAQTGDLDITDDLTIVGADRNATIINGGGLDRVFHVNRVGNNPLTVSISNATITNGRAPDASGDPDNSGGAILNEFGILAIDNCVLHNNRAGNGGSFGGRGGAIYSNVATTTITNSSIANNTTGNGTFVGGMGGGVAALQSTVIVRGSIISNNQTGDGQMGSNLISAGRGGGIESESGDNPKSGTLTVSDSTISNNVTGIFTNGMGGGIDVQDDLTLDNSAVSNNTSYHGGGIEVDNGTVQRILDSTIANNTSQGGEGGGIHNEAGTIVLISGSTISGNQATNTSGIAGGGGMFSQGPIGTIVNSTISDNSTNGTGGGIHNENNIDHIINVTIADNRAADGGGLYHPIFNNFTPVIGELTNTILADNLGGGTLDFREDGQVTSAHNNLVEDPTGNSLVNGVNGNIVGKAPLLGALANNGGPTQTRALLAGSPAVDAGLSGPGVPAIDQRGVSRPQGPGADIGALEAPANRAPIANNQSVSTNEDTPLSGAVTASDADNDPLKYAVVTGPAHGTVQLTTATGAYTYTPADNYNGPDSFTFKANDGIADSNVATVSIAVIPVNDVPVAIDESYTISKNNPLLITAPGVLTNDTDADGDALTAVLVTGPLHGSVMFNSDGSFTYTPTPGYTGSDSIRYKANDGQLDSNVATVRLSVNDDAPVANNDSYTTPEDSSLTIQVPGVLANDTDVNGDALSAALVSGPAHGAVTLNSDGSFLYMPAADFSGSDAFTYRANDGSLSAQASVTIFVTQKPATTGKVNGSGALDRGVRQFNMSVQSREQAGGLNFTGQVSFEDRQLGIAVASTSVTYLRVEADGVHAKVRGTATVNGVSGYTFTIYVEDHGEPGRKDTFRIILTGPGGFAYDSLDFALLGGLLDSGNIQVKRR
jgi:CSLREA domain-containing protein